jgi:hypothetical protein
MTVILVILNLLLNTTTTTVTTQSNADIIKNQHTTGYVIIDEVIF